MPQSWMLLTTKKIDGRSNQTMKDASYTHYMGDADLLLLQSLVDSLLPLLLQLLFYTLPRNGQMWSFYY